MPWAEYLSAAGRKIRVARYHRDVLETLLGATPYPVSPPIAIQAHFEGVLYAFVATTDQLAEAIELGLGGGGNRRTLDQVLTRLPRVSPWEELRAWSASPIVRDVRGIRKKATHHHYRKTPRGIQLEVEALAASGYEGPRTLREYTSAAVKHLGELQAILEAVEERLDTEPSDATTAVGRSDTETPDARRLKVTLNILIVRAGRTNRSGGRR
jgi:hypothetical protein